jgi:hypothetical protein
VTVLVAGAAGVLGRGCVAALDGAVEVRPVRLGPDLSVVGADLLLDVSTAPPTVRVAALEAALRAGVPVVTSTLSPEVLAWARAEGDRLARAHGTVLLAGVASTGIVGGWLAPLAAARTAPTRDVHVTYALPDRGGVRRSITPGLRAELPALVASAAPVLERGELTDEPLAGRRRLAWFPRPVGPAHAATLASVEPVTLPTVLPELETAHSYLAMSSWRAELLQAAANASRTRWLGPRVARRLGRPRPASGGTTRDRWACVAEADGAQGIVRAWAYGRDPVGTGTAALAELVTHLVAGTGRPPGAAAGGHAGGHVGVAAVADPRTALDGVARRTDLRWSVTDPGPAPGRPRV